MVQYNTRYYSPSLGRVINRDTIGEAGGLNLYAYVLNDPANNWDYLGYIVSNPFYRMQRRLDLVTKGAWNMTVGITGIGLGVALLPSVPATFGFTGLVVTTAVTAGTFNTIFGLVQVMEGVSGRTPNQTVPGTVGDAVAIVSGNDYAGIVTDTAISAVTLRSQNLFNPQTASDAIGLADNVITAAEFTQGTIESVVTADNVKYVDERPLSAAELDSATNMSVTFNPNGTPGFFNTVGTSAFRPPTFQMTSRPHGDQAFFEWDAGTMGQFHTTANRATGAQTSQQTNQPSSLTDQRKSADKPLANPNTRYFIDGVEHSTIIFLDSPFGGPPKGGANHYK